MEKLGYYLAFPFVRYALVVGVLIALCSALLGVILVLKRFSFIGDGLSHVAFGAIAIASVVKITSNLVFVFPVTILAAVILLKTGQNKKIHGDAAIAMISVGALAVSLTCNTGSALCNPHGQTFSIRTKSGSHSTSRSQVRFSRSSRPHGQ